jgi:hypothetical protein
MNSKTDQSQPRTSPDKAVRKIRKGTTETSRLFLDVDEIIRRTQTQTVRLTRYVE